MTKGEDNSITLTAKADVLTSDEFYGGNAGNKIVVSFPVKISADAETLKDENLGHLEIDGKKLAHLQKVSDLQKLSGFTDLVKSKDNEYVYAFLNQAKTHIDSQIKYEGQTGVKDRTTDKVQTAVETADPTIKKESSKYEWQVGDNNLLESQLIKKESEEFLNSLIRGLKYPYKEVIYLQYHNKLNSRQIAEILETNSANVRKISSRAKEQLKKGMLKKGYTYEF